MVTMVKEYVQPICDMIGFYMRITAGALLFGMCGLLLLSIGLCCSPPPREQTILDLVYGTDHPPMPLVYESEQLREVNYCFYMILAGKGKSMAKGGESCLESFLALLESNDADIRGVAISSLSLSSSYYYPKRRYAYMLDAYADAGQMERVKECVFATWKRSKELKVQDEDTVLDQLVLAELVIEVYVRDWIWKNPSATEQVGLERHPPPFRGWDTSHLDYKDYFFCRQILKTPDARLLEVWNDYLNNPFRKKQREKLLSLDIGQTDSP